MGRDLGGASATGLLGGIAAILIGWVRVIPLDLAYYLAAAFIGGMAYGVFNHRQQAEILEAALSRLPMPSADVAPDGSAQRTHRFTPETPSRTPAAAEDESNHDSAAR